MSAILEHMTSTLDPKLQKHYLQFSTFTNPGLYKQGLIDNLPNDIREIGLLVRQNFIHRTTLAAGNTGTNTDLRFGDMARMPWWRQAEDDNLPTAAAMLAELYFRDEHGFTPNREVENKLVLTCRFVSILMASILKSKGIPTRVRSGFAPYFGDDKSYDHWINQYWSSKESRWITIDVDGSLSLSENFDPYDMPDGKFEFAANAWLDIRRGKANPKRYYNAGGFYGLQAAAWELFYDFHCLMNNEIVYLHRPKMTALHNFPNITKDQLEQMDNLAELMLNPDKNYEQLLKIWTTEKEFRLLEGGLL